MKNFLKYILQKTLGLNLYLYLFARFVILKLPYNKREKDFLKFIDLINDGDHVLDIGANIGAMTYYFSKKLPNSAIHSFEPIPENLKVLLRVKQKLKLLNVKTYSCAIGEKNGIIEMIMPEKSKVYFHGLSHVISNSEQKGRINSVEIKRLDDIKELNKVKVSAIKIDVEEYEYKVLMGAERLIKKNKPIIYCELWDSENRRKSTDFIKSLDYKICIHNGNKIIEYKDQKGFQNFFFIPVGNPAV